MFLSERIILAKTKEKIQGIQVDIFILDFVCNQSQIILERDINICFFKELIDKLVEFEFHDNFAVQNDSLK